MATMDKTNFVDWLTEEIKRRGLTYREVARRAGLSSGAISQVTTGRNRPGPEFCRSVARALSLPPEQVFRQAGLLPCRGGNPTLTELTDIINTLPPERLAILHRVAQALLYEAAADDA